MRCRHVTANLRGLTVLELLIALTILALVVGLGVPALRDFSGNAQRVAAVNGMLGAIHFARSASLTRNATAVLCKTSDLRSCSDSDSDGSRWIVAVDDSGDAGAAGAVPGATVLRVVDVRFSGTLASNRARFEFRPFPSRSTNGTISFCDARGGAAQRAIVISYTGRPRLAAPDADSGLPACATG